MRNGEALGKRPAVAVVAVQELNDSGRLTGCAAALFDAVTLHGVYQPDTALHDESVRAPKQELVDDPAESALELIAEPDLHERVLSRHRPPHTRRRGPSSQPSA